MGVIEIARVKARPDAGDAFERQVASALQVVAAAPGAGRCRVFRGIEDPQSFVLLIEWASVEAHTAFRNSPALPRYRSFIGDLLTGTPDFGHYRQCAAADSALGE
jgi:quinol monooxygenase YgiN